MRAIATIISCAPFIKNASGFLTLFLHKTHKPSSLDYIVKQ